VGIGSLVIGVAVWIVIFGRLVPRLAGEFSTIHTTAVAALSVAILGTLLNDGGHDLVHRRLRSASQRRGWMPFIRANHPRDSSHQGANGSYVPSTGKRSTGPRQSRIFCAASGTAST
jgi:hypothetical protein